MFWATKQKRETNEVVFSEETCPVCSQKSKHEIIGVQKYFTVYGISFFPTSKTLIKACGNCKFVKEIRVSKIQNALDAYSVEALFTSKGRWKYFAGIYVIGLLVMVILYFVFKYEF